MTLKGNFYETFKELQVEFKKVFRSLFKGGDASLTLTDPDNLMETGVDIVASPPGKKLKTITLLSGGEKILNLKVIKQVCFHICILNQDGLYSNVWKKMNR